MTSHIQAVLFDKNFWKVPDARKQLKHMKLKAIKKEHVTGAEKGNIRFRIVEPDYDKHDYRLIVMSPEMHIKAIVGYPKGGGKTYDEIARENPRLDSLGMTKDEIMNIVETYGEEHLQNMIDAAYQRGRAARVTRDWLTDATRQQREMRGAGLDDFIWEHIAKPIGEAILKRLRGY